MLISVWSSDVCSSDLAGGGFPAPPWLLGRHLLGRREWRLGGCTLCRGRPLLFPGEVLHGLELDLFVEKNARPRALYPSDSTLQFAEIGNGKPHFHAQLQRGFDLDRKRQRLNTST